MNICKYRGWLLTTLLFGTIFICAFNSIVLGKDSKDTTIIVVGNYGYIEKYDSNWKLLSKYKIPGLVRQYNICDVAVSQNGSLIFLAVSKKETPLIIVNTKDLSVNNNYNVTFPSPGFVTYYPMNLIAVSSRYLYMTDESYTAGADPFMSIMIDIEKGTTMRISTQVSLNKEDISISPQGEILISRGLDKFYIVDVPSGKVVDSISIPLDYKGRELSPFNVDWANKKINIYNIKANNEQIIDELELNIKTHKAIKLTSKKIDIPNKIKRTNLNSTGNKYLIEDEKENFYVVDSKAYKVLNHVGQDKTSLIKGYDLTSYLSPDDKQLIYLKHDIKQINEKYKKDITRLNAINLKTNKIMKELEYPEKVVAVLFITNR